MHRSLVIWGILFLTSIIGCGTANLPTGRVTGFGENADKADRNIERAYYYMHKGDINKLVHHTKLAIEALEQTDAYNTPELADILYKVGYGCIYIGKLERGMKYLNRALEFYKEEYGDNHLLTAYVKSLLSVGYAIYGDYENAEESAKAALIVYENELGADSFEIIFPLQRLADAQMRQGKLYEAEKNLLRGLNINEAKFGPGHSKNAPHLKLLSKAAQLNNNYDAALAYITRAINLTQSDGEKSQSLLINCKLEKANIYIQMGEYGLAKDILEETLLLQSSIWGDDCPNAGYTHSYLSFVYFGLGNSEAAERHGKKALKILNSTIEEGHYLSVNIYNNIGLALLHAGKIDEAESFFNKAIDTSIKALGKDNMLANKSILNLGKIAMSRGEHKQAEEYYDKYLEITKRRNVSSYLPIAFATDELGDVQRSQGRFLLAEEKYGASLNLFNKVFSYSHPYTALTLFNLALVSAGKNNHDDFLKFLMRAEKVDDKFLDQTIGYASEEQRLLFLTERKWALEAVIGLAATTFQNIPEVRKCAFEIWIKRKGFVLKAQKKFQEAVISNEDQISRELFSQLNESRKKLSALIYSRSSADVGDKVVSLHGEIQEIERQLIKHSKRYSLNIALQRANLKDIMVKLPSDAVLVEFALVRLLGARHTRWGKKNERPEYIAFVLNPNNSNAPEIIRLGPAEAIDSAIAKYKRIVTNTKNINPVRTSKASRDLYSKIFGPLRKFLGSASTVYISPDGNINLIPFEVLQNEAGRFLIEDYTFNYLSSGQDLMSFGYLTNGGKPGLLIGDPDFESDPAEIELAASNLGLSLNEGNNPIISRHLPSRMKFSRLPGTLEEVKALSMEIGEANVRVLTGRMAFEEAAFHHERPDVLHFATHGFFLADASQAVNGNKALIANPLLRSGLALAGANQSVKRSEFGDGILTAEEVLGLKLWGTKLVVLSACETGLGEVKAGEGVYGLRRAFSQAGAKSIVMSMWAVPDKETKELMARFYNNMYRQQMNRCQALREAAINQMKLTQTRYGHRHPLFWGAFVFLGEAG